MRLKIISLFIATCLCLVACGVEEKKEKSTEVTEIATEAVTEQETETIIETEERTEVTTEDTEAPTTEEEKEEVDYSPYYEIIEKIESINLNDSSEDMVYPDIYSPEDTDVSLIFYESYFEQTEQGYAFIDIDNNGIDELILGSPGEYGIVNIYTIEETKLKSVFYGWERYSCHLTDDNKIVTHGSSGAAYVTHEIYSLSGSDLVYLDGIYTDQGDPEIIFFHGDGRERKANDPQISREEAFAILDSYPPKDIEFTVFDRYKQ